MPKSKSPTRGGNDSQPPSKQRRATTGTGIYRGDGHGHHPPTQRRASQDNPSSSHQLRRSFTKGDELTEVMLSKLPSSMFNVARNSVNGGNIPDVSSRTSNPKQQSPPKHWKEAARPTTNTNEGSDAPLIKNHQQHVVNPNRRVSIDSAQSYSDTNSSSNWSIWSDSASYNSVSTGTDSYLTSESYTSSAASSQWNPLTSGSVNGNVRDWLVVNQSYARRSIRVLLGVVALVALSGSFAYQYHDSVFQMLFGDGGNDQIIDAEEEWDPIWNKKVNQQMLRKLPQQENVDEMALPPPLTQDMVPPPPPLAQDVNNGVGDTEEQGSDWESQLRSWKPAEEENVEDEGGPKWDPKPQNTNKEVVPNQTSQTRAKGKNDALTDLREKNRLEHLENWKD